MIYLTKIKGEIFLVNCDLIETVACSPDTVITFSGGKQIMVRESLEEIREKVIQFRRSISLPAHFSENESA